MLLLTCWKSAKHVKTFDWVSDKRFSRVLMCFSIIMSVLKGFLRRLCSINASKKIKEILFCQIGTIFFRILIINGFGQ